MSIQMMHHKNLKEPEKPAKTEDEKHKKMSPQVETSEPEVMLEALGADMRLEFVNKFESDVDHFIGEADTMKEKLAKIERLQSVIHIIQSDTKTTFRRKRTSHHSNCHT